MSPKYLKQDILIITVGMLLCLLLMKIINTYFYAFVIFITISMVLFLLCFTRRTWKTKSVLFICLLVMLAITGTEVAALYYYKTHVLNPPDIPRYQYERTSYWEDDKTLGYRPVPSSSVRTWKKADDDIIYNTEYTFTEDGLRTTKSYSKSQCSFLFFGGRKVFGEGLPDIQTLPYQFSRKLNYNYNVLNYSFHGYGPHQMLRILESGISNLSNTNIAAIFYLLTPEDIDKVSGNYEPFRKGPKYIFVNDDLSYVGQLGGTGGLFNSGYDFIQGVISIAKYSQLVNLIARSANSHLQGRHKKHELLSGILLKANKLARETYNSRLVLILEERKSLGSQVLSKFNQSNIDFINLDEVLTQEPENYYLDQDKLIFNDKLNNELSTVLANRYGDCQ